MSKQLHVVQDGPALEDGMNRDVFFRSLIGELSQVIQDVVGLDDAAGLVTVVGQRIGRHIDDLYKTSSDRRDALSREEVSEVLVDLKRRIGGDFYIIEADEERIVLGNRACPFGDKVAGRQSLCMMTSNVFGYITAQNLGYGRVELQETIAAGDPGCRVVVHLKPAADDEAAEGREYFQDTEDAQPE